MIALILESRTRRHTCPMVDSPNCGEVLARVLCNPSTNPSTAEHVLLSILSSSRNESLSRARSPTERMSVRRTPWRRKHSNVSDMLSQLFRALSAFQEAAAVSTRIVVVSFPPGSAITQVVWTFQEDPAVVIPAISLPVRHRDLNDQHLDTRINRSHFASACSSFIHAACEVNLKCLRRPSRASPSFGYFQ